MPTLIVNILLVALLIKTLSNLFKINELMAGRTETLISYVINFMANEWSLLFNEFYCLEILLYSLT